MNHNSVCWQSRWTQHVLAAAAFAAVVAAGCGKGGGTETVGGGGAPSTSSTVKAIQDKIDADPEMKGAKVTVVDKSGSIDLTGTVKSIAQHDKAESVTLDVQTQMKQQISVNNDLMVESGNGGGASGGQ